MGWNGSISGDVGVGCNDPSMNSGSYNQARQGSSRGIFVSTYSKTVGEPYDDFGSQTEQLNVRHYHRWNGDSDFIAGWTFDVFENLSHTSVISCVGFFSTNFCSSLGLLNHRQRLGSLASVVGDVF